MKTPSDFSKETLSRMMAYAGGDLFERREIEETTFSEYTEETWTIEDFQNVMATAIAAIPTQCMSSARVSLFGGYEESSGLKITYARMETDTEVDGRVMDAYGYAQGCDAKERAEFERFKTKFGRV